MTIISLVVLAGFAFYVMNRDERTRVLKPALVLVRPATWVTARAVRAVRWLGIGLVTGNPWAVTGVVTAVVLILNAPSPGVDWRSITDVRSEIDKLLATEEATVRAYDAAVAQFQLGVLSAEALASTIKTTVMPELQAITERLHSLNAIPPEHRRLLTLAEEYLQLRRESWRLRVEALEERSMARLKTAERIERVSLEALARVRGRDKQ